MRLSRLAAGVCIALWCIGPNEEYLLQEYSVAADENIQEVREEGLLADIKQRLMRYQAADSKVVFMKGSAYETEGFIFDSGIEGPGVLFLGGVHGDEPGAYIAPSRICSTLEVYKGRVVIIPKASMPAIEQGKRYGAADLNRQFGINAGAGSCTKSPEYELALGLKQFIISQNIDAFVNLHEGSHRWAQTFPYDSEAMSECLEALADSVNSVLPFGEHFRPKLFPMPGTATYFGANELGVLSFGVETSKEFSKEHSAFIHELVIYNILRMLGIESNMLQPKYDFYGNFPEKIAKTENVSE